MRQVLCVNCGGVRHHDGPGRPSPWCDRLACQEARSTKKRADKRRAQDRTLYGPTDGRVACRICGLERHALEKHLSARHGLSVSEYRERFPAAPVSSEHLTLIAKDRYSDLYGERYWTEERIIAAIRAYAYRRGRPPRQAQWLRPTGVGRHETSRTRPHARTVEAAFGSFSAAVTAAGLVPHGPGRPRKVAA